MKNLKALLTWGLLLAATHVMGYTITVSPTQIETGQSTNLIINLNNTETNLTAYQMKLFLPTGVTIQKKANGKYAYTANADRHDGAFTFTVKDAADGSVLIAVFSPDKDVITGTSGELIRLPIDVASSVTSSLQGSLKEIEFTDVNTQAYNISDVNFTLTIGGTDKEQQTLSLASLPEMIEGDAAYSLPQQTNQGLTLTWTVTDATIASINGYQLTPLKAGTTTVTATQAGNSNYLPFTKTFTLTVNERQTQPEIEVTDISQLDNVIYIEPTEARCGEEKVLSIKMKNNVPIQTIKFDLYLPEGVSVVRKNNKLITPSTERIDEYDTFKITSLSNGSIRLLALAAIENEDGTITNISAGDGEICQITIKPSDDMEEGDYPIIFKETQLVERNNTLHSPEPNIVQTKLTVFSYILGDANSDGNVDAIDFNMIANKVLGYDQSNFNIRAADINGDGEVDAIDFNMIANKILYDSFSGKQ